MSSHPPAPVVGRFTGFVLGFMVFVCVTMIGGAGYLKYQLDTAEAVLAAPDEALRGEQGAFDKLRRDLGYGGFLGLAQSYVSSHDTSLFAEMKQHVKSADDIVAHLPDKTPAETRHELVAIVAANDAALKKITENPTGEFTAPDLVPLYAALPILDARVSAASAEVRLAAQSKMQFWAMLMTLVSWCSLIIAAACTAGIYLTLRDKHSAPLRALAQSIQNMARGDMRTPIWGTERQDMIGELARSADMARYHFSHLPDLSLLSDQGPIRMRFEGETRSLFEAMMKAISKDSENIREKSVEMTSVAAMQKVSITQLSQRVEAVLRDILQRGLTGDAQIKQAIQEMVGSANGLKNAHAHAADQLNRLIPYIQERATGMGEIAQIAGKQIGQMIQSLSTSELGLKANAENAKTTLIKLASTADELGERLFGAINLLQASGKVLGETADQVKLRFGDTLTSSKVDLAPLSERLEEIAAQIVAMQEKLTQRQVIQPAPTAVPENAGSSTQDIIAGIEQILSARIEPQSSAIEQTLLEEIVAKISAMEEKLTQQQETQPAPMPVTESAGASTEDIIAGIEQIISARIDPKFSAIGQSLAESSVHSAVKMNTALAELSDKIGHLSTTIADAIADNIGKIASRTISSNKASAIDDDATQRQIEQQTQILSELVATLGIIDEHMQQIKSEMRMTGQR